MVRKYMVLLTIVLGSMTYAFGMEDVDAEFAQNSASVCKRGNKYGWYDSRTERMINCDEKAGCFSYGPTYLHDFDMATKKNIKPENFIWFFRLQKMYEASEEVSKEACTVKKVRDKESDWLCSLDNYHNNSASESLSRDKAHLYCGRLINRESVYVRQRQIFAQKLKEANELFAQHLAAKENLGTEESEVQ